MDTSPLVAIVPVAAGLLSLEFGISSTIAEVVATVGLEDGLIGPRLFSAMLLIVLLSAALPMVLLRDPPSELER